MGTIQRPAGRGMLERRTLLRIMAFRTRILAMAVVAERVHVYSRECRCPIRFLKIVATAATLLPMAVDTAQTKQVDVFPVEERDDRRGLVRRVIGPDVRLGDHRMSNGEDIG